MTDREAARLARESLRRIELNTALLQGLHPGFSTRLCLWMAIQSEQLVYGSRWAETPRGILLTAEAGS